MSSLLRVCTSALLLALPLLLIVTTAEAQTQTYTSTADFECPPPPNSDCTGINVTTAGDEVKLINIGEAFDFVWVAASSRGTIVKIDANTGAVLGEYLSSPDGRSRNPSRTTVDANGNVWAGNRDEAGDFGGPVGLAHGSVVKIGLEENGQCVDRNSSGTIETSTGLGDVLDWPDITDGAGSTDGAPHLAQVQDAVDECILIYQRLPDAENVRHVSVDSNNDVWIGGYPFDQRMFHKLAETTGAILASFDARDFVCGGYGGLIDANGILWSASISQNKLLRYDIANSTGSCIDVSSSYGLGIDTNGFVWNSTFGSDSVFKIDPTGAPIMGPFTTLGASGDRGVAVTPSDNHVWVANSFGSDVSRLDNNGNFIATITVGSEPTGVAVDGNGKVWATNLNSHSVSRIDPGTNMEEFAVDLNAVMYDGLNAGPYNYSDMTGSTLTAPPNNGTWSVIYDTGTPGTEGCRVFWNDEPEGAEPGTTSITVEARAADVDPPGGAFVPVAYGIDPGLTGQFFEVRAKLDRGSETAPVTPVLSDLTVACNLPPVCDDAFADPDEIWPPNHKFVDVHVLGVTDPDGDPVTLTVTGITQDEPVDTYGDGRFVPDGMGVGSYPAQVRAERSGTKKVPGNGRVYEIFFTADDGNGGECTGAVNVCVPHDQRPGHECIDDRPPVYDSMSLSPRVAEAETPAVFEVTAYPNPFNPVTTITYALPEATYVRLTIYDVTGREVARLVDNTVETGTHQVAFDASSLPSGVYLYRLQAGTDSKAGKMLLIK